MRRNKTISIVFIIMEALITIGMIVQKNYYAATGWVFLMFTNIDILIENEKKSENKQ